ncbi:hypothetical protein BZM27_18690 [Paraburkholderia steynii]|uniref:Uncharacterized protein n=1 Tax=Paraburkholderia steynii TaxID=1245441 RepID=A0A4R0XEG5_9BURK|nr:hypothetical protein BZM27_18690 [Paraburkholderia steynii]
MGRGRCSSGRNVEVINGWVCLPGVGEADHLVPLLEHPNRQMIAKVLPGGRACGRRLPLTHEEFAIAQGAMSAARRQFDASPAGIAPRLPRAVWAKIAAEDVE